MKFGRKLRLGGQGGDLILCVYKVSWLIRIGIIRIDREAVLYIVQCMGLMPPSKRSEFPGGSELLTRRKVL